MGTPEVSVVIPSYNCSEFLPEAVDSVFNQSLQDLELIVVDDGSTDNTRDVVRKFSSDTRLRYVYQENRGLPGARNRGVAEAHGSFVAVLDGDDTLEKNALELMHSSIKASNATWCVIDITKFWGRQAEHQQSRIPADELMTAILREDFIRRGMFFRRDALLRVGMWDEKMKNREDWDLNIRLIQRDEPFVYLPLPLYRYRWRSGSITTGNVHRVLQYTELLLKKHHKVLADGGNSEAAILYAQNMWSLARRYFYETHDARGAIRCAKESAVYDLDLNRLLHPIWHSALQVFRKI
jgi:glycosyltransferase involved in cell wall biosynthesis